MLTETQRDGVLRACRLALLITCLLLALSCGSKRWESPLSWPAEPAQAQQDGGSASVTTGELKVTRRDIPADYFIRKEGDAYVAENPANDMELLFSPTGVSLREVQGEGVLLEAGLVDIGRGGDREVQQLVAMELDSERLEYRRGDVVEWYINTPEGLEQGFDILKSPPGEGSLEVHVRLAGPELSVSGEGLSLEIGGRHLFYRGLSVRDAGGRMLPASLRAYGDGGALITVEDAGALYPLVIDPLIGDEGIILIAPGNGASLGGTYAIRWSTSGSWDEYGTVDLQWSDDDFATATSIAAGITVHTLTYAWDTSTLADNVAAYQIRIQVTVVLPL
ncbi:MAG: hypothetical protein HQL31_05910, partial [Planctomycetes bacterium]|nr:hypothetical protein [Planctomycetota bacterium]